MKVLSKKIIKKLKYEYHDDNLWLNWVCAWLGIVDSLVVIITGSIFRTQFEWKHRVKKYKEKPDYYDNQ